MCDKICTYTETDRPEDTTMAKIQKELKKIIIAESYNGWYAYFDGDDPDRDCIVDGLANGRRCYYAVCSALNLDESDTIEIEYLR